jgi:hypothetical protein
MKDYSNRELIYWQSNLAEFEWNMYLVQGFVLK